MVCLAKFNIYNQCINKYKTQIQIQYIKSIHISNRFVIVCNIQVVIRMLYHSFETLLFLSSLSI